MSIPETNALTIMADYELELCDQLGWLSELIGHQEDIAFSIQELGSLIPA